MARYAPGFVARAGAKKNQTKKRLMKTTNVTIQQVANELVKTFRNDERTAERLKKRAEKKIINEFKQVEI